MLTRRDCLTYVVLMSTALPLRPGLLRAIERGKPMTRKIPTTDEELPIVGLGCAATFSRLAGSDDTSALREVLRVLFDNGGTVIDTAPAYGASEAVAGSYVGELGATDKVFWATKLNAAGWGGGAADPDAAWAQLEQSFERIGKDPIDLIQVHNLADIPTQLAILKELKEQGRVRYIGTTSTRSSRYTDLARVMREEPLDFIGVDYAVDNREAAKTILPLALDRGIAVLLYVPFGRTRLWRRVAGVELPDWAAEFDANSWAQFFIKYAAAHPAVTCVTPATSKPKNMLDNIGAAYGALPDRAMQRRMEAFVDALPSA
jgi:aryl-alcohol dehydrogenase-like predicted oxidoreductase